MSEVRCGYPKTGPLPLTTLGWLLPRSSLVLTSALSAYLRRVYVQAQTKADMLISSCSYASLHIFLHSQSIFKKYYLLINK